MSTNHLQDIVDSGIDLVDIEQCSTHKFSSEADLVKAITELNQLYVHQRQKLQANSLTPRLSSAYLHFYFPSNIPKLFKLLQLLPPNLIDEIGKVPWIDFGSGPATYTLAWYSWLRSQKKKFPPEALLIESDMNMQAVANKVLDKYLSNEDITLVSDLSKKNILGGALFFGHSSNELSLDQLFQIIQQTDPKFIILLEPGTPEVFKKILELRSHLISHNYKIHYPCLQQGVCPMKQQTVAKNWCHQYLSLRFSSSVERLTQLVSLKRQHSAVLFHVYEKNALSGAITTFLPPGSYRVVQGPMQTKGVWTWQVCTAEGKLEWLETLTRQYSKEQLDLLENKTPGTILSSITVQKELKPGYLRVLVGQL